MTSSNSRIVYLKLLLTAIFWGGTFIAGRVVAQNVGPYSAAFLRFALASGMLVFAVRKMEGQFPALNKRQFISVVVLGLTGVFAYNVFFFKGLKIIYAGRASLIVATNPIFISLFSSFIFKERLNLLKVVGIILSFAGAVIVISRGHLASILQGSFGLGEAFILGCVFSWVSYSLIGKAVMKELSPLVIVAYSSLVGTIGLLPAAYFEGLLRDFGQVTLLAWTGIFYLAVFGTVLGFIWYYEGINKIGPTRASLFINFVPVSAIILAFLLLNEVVTLSLLAGAVLVSTGVYFTNRRAA